MKVPLIVLWLLSVWLVREAPAAAPPVRSEGVFVGLEPLRNADPADTAPMFYREHTVVICGDSVFLNRTLICYQGGMPYRVAPSGTVSASYAGRMAHNDGRTTVFLAVVRCESCRAELRQNPETGVYEEVPERGETVELRFDGDMVYFGDIPCMKKR